MMDNKGRGFHDFLVLIPITLLIVIHIFHLSLPYFWDEAWSYMNAIRKMAEAGPSLLPGVVSLEYCKGHPQLFYFISSCWFKFLPFGITEMRLLPLVTAVVLLLAFYFGIKKIGSPQTAGMGVVLLGVQSMFIAQSILILPEMMATVWLLLAFFAFTRYKYKAYSVLSSLMVLTKETTLIFAAVFVLCYFVFHSDESKDNWLKLKNILLIFLSLITYSIFLVVHKLAFGVFFYPEHLGYVSYQWDSLIDKAGSAFVTAFIHYGRLPVLLFIIGATFFIGYKRIQLRNYKALICLGLMIPAYLLFLGINFYSPRYTLSLVVLFIAAFSLVMESVPLKSLSKWIISIFFSVLCLYYSLESKREIDIDLGYVEVIEVNREVVKYCEENDFYEQPIAASFNMNLNLKDESLGYLSNGRIFSNVNGLDHYMQAKYVIYETTSTDKQLINRIKSQFSFIKSFKNKHAFGFIFKNPAFSLKQDTISKN